MGIIVEILSVKYKSTGPEIIGSLSFDNLGELTDEVLFASASRNGQWKVHDFGRGGPPPRAGKNKMLVSMVEVGRCDPLREGDMLAPARSCE